MKRIIVLSTIMVLITTGITGCGASTSSNIDSKAEEVVTAPIIKKQPTVKKTREDSYDFCERQGHEIIIRFDKEAEISKAYCRFADTTECDAQEYFYGTCAPSNGSAKYEPKKEESELIFCAENYSPVCGENYITYSNECIAKTQGIKIKYESVCLETQTNDAATQASPSNSTVTTATKTRPDWINLLIDILESETPKTPPAYINQCIYANKTVYYQSDGCKNCYDILYNEAGQVTCYPSHDLAEECENYFKNSTGCKRLWTDIRK